MLTYCFSIDLRKLNYYPGGMQMPGRSYTSANSYRYGFGGHEKDDEISGTGNWYSFGDYGYMPRIGRRPGMDPKFNSIPGISPYSYALNNPIILKDPDGELPIIPFLLKASASAGADALLQASMIFLTDDNVETFGEALTKIDKTDVALSFLEGLNPFRVPGGELGEAALVGFADVLVGITERSLEGEENTGEAIAQDFFIGIFAQLTGGQVKKLLNNKGARKKLRSLLGDQFDALVPARSFNDIFEQGSLIKKTEKSIIKRQSGSASEAFDEIVRSAGGTADDVVVDTEKGIKTFTKGKQTFTLRGSKQGDPTISKKTEDVFQQVKIRFDEE